ncbi:MAG TPA: inositol monophosphatase family protein [Deltaproteobacteria bacterium]|jgi:myo-inositol-1(or 4)-monophosphatase|nr:inositol monophosphatase family protein [Deltaproteobacteria bacterium]HOI06390.1 inositol monophosphatase family protein [Deltaproteobacteria bacterium]
MLDFVIHLAQKAGNYLKENIGSDLNVELKGRINPVTRVDKASQDIIFETISREFPDHAVIAEEGLQKETGSEYTWYVDPLDGTVNYMHQIPIFCVSIGVFKEGEPYIGVCFNPVSGELFYSQRGSGAFQNGERIRVSSTSRLIDALVVTGFPYNKDMHDGSIVRFTRILSEVQGIRRLGSAALDLCYVARGSFDGFWEVGLSSWDIAAGVAIVLEAGGFVTDFSGKPMDLESGNILAANGIIHAGLLRLM